MRLNVFRQFLLEGSTENSPEEVSSQTIRDDSKTQENTSKSVITQSSKSSKENSSINTDRQKRLKTSKQEVSVYRSKTGSLYATKAPRIHSTNKENEIVAKVEKEKSPPTEQRNIKKRKYISKVNNATIKDTLPEAKDAKRTEISRSVERSVHIIW